MPLGIRNPLKGRQPGTTQTTAPLSSSTQQQGPTTGPLSTEAAASNGSTSPELQQADRVQLVNYSPEELLRHVETTLSRVHFGMSFPHRWKELAGEIWSVLGPIVLFAGTAGEVFFFIWNNVADTTAWWVALSVLATVAVLECTFMVLSYKCDTLRNQLKLLPDGGTVEDKRDLRHHHGAWFVLGAGVAFGQISFLVFSMMAHFNNLPFLVAFAIGRSVVTLAADYYTAFIHRAAPTTGARAKMQEKERDDLAADLLKAAEARVRLLNEGILHLREVTVEAEMKEDRLRTRLAVEKMQNQEQIETIRTQQEQAALLTRMGNSMLRALFDPTLSDAERERSLTTLQALMAGVRELPPGRITDIREEEV